MKIALIQYDGTMPNLALMKLSTYYKQQGAQVQLNDERSDEHKIIYVKKVIDEFVAFQDRVIKDVGKTKM